MSIAAFSIKRRITILMAAFGVLVFGGFSLNRLELKLLPEINYPALTVRTELEGAPPEEVEDLVSRPIEEALGVINNLQTITSISRAGLSDVVIEFHWNTEMDKALMDVREKLDTVVLPDTAERPRILRYNPETEPILKLSLTGEDLVAMHAFAENEIKPRLETLEGVAAARIIGGEEEEILIELDTQRLAALGLDLNNVSTQLAMENINSPGGLLQEGNTQYLVRTVNEFETVDDIAAVVIGSNNGVDVRLGDAAVIRRSLVERKALTHLDGQESVLIDIYKEGDANIISVTDAVRNELGNRSTGRFQRVKSLRSMLSEDMDIVIISDQSVFIRAAINEVRAAAVMGCFLAMLVLFLFMRNLSNTIIIGLSIPVSIIATFTLMYFQHISLNLMSLGGLALGIGMLVDNSIVVLENIFRLKEEGLSAAQAAQTGTEQVTTAVIASTLTTIAVFFPILFVKGIAGQIFNDLAWTIAFSLLASLVVALSLLPMIASLRRDALTAQPVEPIQVVTAWKEYIETHRHRSGPIRFTGGIIALLRRSVITIIAIYRDALKWPFTRPGNRSGTGGIILAVVFFPFRFIFHCLAATLAVAAKLIINGTWIIVAVPLWSIRGTWPVVQWMLGPF
nr:efflux RND transporter permease subunit [bacterium]